MSNRFQTLEKKFHTFSRKAVRYCHNASRLLKKNKGGNIVLWSELDENLLGEILSRLSLLSDQVRFHAVCKRWHSIRPITTCTTSLPWFVSMKFFPSRRSKSLRCRIYEPYSSTKFCISTCKISLSKLRIPNSSPMNFTCTLGHSWFFISVCQTNSSGDHTSFFLFSLLSRKLIQLPKLHNYSIMSSPPGFIHRFSTNPDSPDCVFLISNIGDESEFVIMTCRQGDKEWTARKFDNFMQGSCIAEYINGAFYIVSGFGQVASYNIMNWEYKIEKLDGDDDFEQLFDSEMEFSMFELNGEIIIMYYSDDYLGEDSNTFPGIPCIKKFDRLMKAWVPLESLGDQTLLVSDEINSIAKVGKEQARNIGVLLNAIYYYSDHGCTVYSLENGALVQLKSSDNTVKSGDSLQLHYRSAIRDEKHMWFWMESPVIW